MQRHGNEPINLTGLFKKDCQILNKIVKIVHDINVSTLTNVPLFIGNLAALFKVVLRKVHCEKSCEYWVCCIRVYYAYRIVCLLGHKCANWADHF